MIFCEAYFPDSVHFVVCLQATLCLCNIASNGDECCRQLYKHNVLVDVIPVLHLSDAEIVHMALCLVEMILHACPEASFSHFFVDFDCICRIDVLRE